MGVGVGVGVDTVAALQAVGAVIILLINVTAPFRARARPAMFAPLSREMLVRAMIVPTKVVVEPITAELPICQKTLQG